ncbi:MULTISPECIES: hypothetical protein [unclassified Pseudofrankia]|uniref:hypothetical protein n=1 Tax=unclassified Pseudofrankia TaxID=2994372 RepID=UPI0008DA9EE7|nr:MULTISPECIES: hypothetical protein [unclassified Pseudofrankia]MDT3444982.1 hypothetical protein [Pseudofrankia sp. BMG5.37]OHV68179.1 hypothetical protein BCD48_03030 [Pseudofrankia sp. BMG5.36]
MTTGRSRPRRPPGATGPGRREPLAARRSSVMFTVRGGLSGVPSLPRLPSFPTPRLASPAGQHAPAGHQLGSLGSSDSLAGHPAAPGVRLARAVVAGGASTSLAIAAHAAAGGAPPSAALVAAAGALLIRLAYGLAGRHRGLPTVLAALAGSQFGLHIAFVLSGHRAANPEHHHVVAPAELLAYGGEHYGAGAGFMILAHLAAVVVTGALLHRAEELLWAAAALRATLRHLTARVFGPLADAVSRLRRLLASVIVGLPPAMSAGVTAVAATPPVPPRDIPVGRAARRRGPPAPRHALTPA